MYPVPLVSHMAVNAHHIELGEAWCYDEVHVYPASY